MRILHTESSLGWGGQEIRVLTEARGVARAGHDVMLAAPAEARIHTEAARFGVPAVALAIGAKGLTGLAAMRGLLAAQRFDVVNTHSSTDSWLTALTCASLDAPPAIVRTRHISAPVPRNASTAWLYRQARRIATTGERLRLQVIAETGADPARVVSVPTGIDLARFRPADRAAARAATGLPPAAAIVGIVATLRSWKGHRYLVDAIAALARADLLLVIVGDGPQRAALERQVAERALGEHVRFAGNRDDVAPWLQSLDLFCLPSYANEGVPQALMQAMACALPVITTDVGSIGEIVTDGENGLMVRPEDAGALRSAIAALLDDPGRRARFASAARVTAQSRFGEALMVERMIALFQASSRAADGGGPEGHRLPGRMLVVPRALAARAGAPGAKRAPEDPRRILIAHHLLLGDTLMLTPLVAKLRALHPQADIALLANPPVAPLYSGRPYGVRVLAFSQRDANTTRSLLSEAPFDLAIVPGDNRFAWLAASMRARHIVAHAGDRPATKSWFVDDLRPFPTQPATWGEIVAGLVDGPEPPPFRPGDWPAPQGAPFERPPAPYAVLHVGASTPLKRWLPERWMGLARHLHERGIAPVWSAGANEHALVDACDPERRFAALVGRLDLAQLWRLLEGAALLVAPDTGVAHLGRVAFTPTVTLYGPGSPVICGRGAFWSATPGRDVTVDPFPCRDQQVLFRREISWARRCGRSTAECPEPRCMHAIGLQSVVEAVEDLL